MAMNAVFERLLETEKNAKEMYARAESEARSRVAGAQVAADESARALMLAKKRWREDFLATEAARAVEDKRREMEAWKAEIESAPFDEGAVAAAVRAMIRESTGI